jgi:tetratricopeptide (TPR) repeat protein
LAEWGNLVEAELGLWQRSPEKSSPEIVVSLLYLLAQVQAEQGNKPLAEQTAERARQLLSVSDPLGIEVRIEIAASLRRRGMIDWAEMEYRRLVGSGQPVVMIDASNHLAEMLHDQGKHLAAAEARRSALDVLQANRLESTGLNEFIKQMRARMNYFYACHWAEQGSAVKQLEYLELALKTDPGEVDTLIACYRLPNQTVQFRQRIMKLIEQDVAKTRNQIAARPEVAEPYNQYAWLVSNTQGDLDEALRFSKKSLELSSNNSAYLDTLAHVYFARGDLENAVKHQAMAVERDPYSNLITRELKRFRAALEEKAKGAKKPAGADRKG